MEPDRYQKNQSLYIFGMFCFLVSMGFFLFDIFVFPNLLFGVRYDVPEFIAFWRESLVSSFAVTEQHASLLISLFFTFCWFLFGLCAYYASTRIDNDIHGINNTSKSSERNESLQFFLKVMIVIGLFYGAIFILLWLLSIPFSFP